MAMSREVALKIIDEVYEGKTVTHITERMGVSKIAFRKLLGEYPDLLCAYERAQIAQSDDIVDEAREIADDPTIDPQVARNRIDIRKWTASKRNPSRYGERIDLNISQVVDIRGALDLKILGDPQPTNIIDVSHHSSSGSKPDAGTNQAEIGDAGDLDTELEDLLK